MAELTCEWCGDTFTRPHGIGPIPKFCKSSHRQRSLEARRGSTAKLKMDADEYKDQLLLALEVVDVAQAVCADTTSIRSLCETVKIYNKERTRCLRRWAKKRKANG